MSKPERPAWVDRARAGWVHRGALRPSFAVPAGPGQESVWDYPRPPIVVPDTRHVVVRLGRATVAETRRAWRLLETSHPPTWYLPRADVLDLHLAPVGHGSFCEWKGRAEYFDVTEDLGDRPEDARIPRAAWSYPSVIDEAYADLEGAIAFYANDLACFVDGERARPQPGGFYGGWITSEIVGPWKGEPGSGAW